MEESKHPFIHDIVQSCAELFFECNSGRSYLCISGFSWIACPQMFTQIVGGWYFTNSIFGFLKIPMEVKDAITGKKRR